MLSVLVGACLVGGLVSPQDDAARLKQLLAGTGLTFGEIEGFSSARLRIGQSERTHTAWVRHAPMEYGALRGYEVYGIFWESETAPSAEMLLEVMQLRYRWGGLLYERPSGAQAKYRIRYRVVVDAEAPAARQREAIDLTCVVADGLEAKYAADGGDRL